ncbi:hypothetical protein CLOSTHATH_03399 [Hungatella hathewayi DSM 13479]|uniref:Uncharacterized protein n=1 Tax=Hungatella hathewayi DSM 13479 TaxID=566550 RepID=D3AIF9_9FIRM|nr:hypothetical protein CLOSTHATH_03399 [Hungatella hathewayi DSM 13479]
MGIFQIYRLHCYNFFKKLPVLFRLMNKPKTNLGLTLHNVPAIVSLSYISF